MSESWVLMMAGFELELERAIHMQFSQIFLEWRVAFLNGNSL